MAMIAKQKYKAIQQTNREDNMTKKDKWDKLETKIMRRLIDITSEDIKMGGKGDDTTCAIALALQESYDTLNVSVQKEDITYLYVNNEELSLSKRMQKKVDDFVELFDTFTNSNDYIGREHKIPKPFTLVIEQKTQQIERR